MRVLSTTVATALVLTANADAQNLLTYDPAGAGLFESQGTSPLTVVTGFGLPVMPYPLTFPLGPTPFGGLTADDASGLIWYTDGFVVAAEPNPAYPGYSAFPPVPPLPIPLFGGPMTGIAIDAAAGILWMTDGFLVAGYAAIPGTPPVTPPFVPPTFGAPLGGLDFDPLTGTLWGVDLGGVAFNFFPGGGPAAPPVLPPGPPLGPAAGIAIDKTGTMVGPARSLYVVWPTTIVNYSTGIAWPSGGVPGAESGLAWIANPSATPPAGVCPCVGLPFGQVVTGPMSTANPAFSVDLIGLPPGYTTFFAFDFLGFDPALPLVNPPTGCPLGMTAAGIFAILVVADPFGTASLPIPLTGVPPGTTVYMQQILPCPSDPSPFGIVLTPMHQVIVSAP